MRGKIFFLFFFIFGGLRSSAFLVLTRFPVRLQQLWALVALGGHSNTNLGRELCAWHVPVPPLVPLLQTGWDLEDLQFWVEHG